MKKILLITASLNQGNTSNSRRLGEYACNALRNQSSDVVIARRDLSQTIPSPMTPNNLSAIVNGDASTPETATHLKESNTYADEIADADQIIIAAPLYNLFIPAGLKAYIDLLIRRGKNFEDSPQGPKGLLADRPLLLIVTSGGPFLPIDKEFLSTYFKRTFGFIGIHSITFVPAENMNMTEKLAEKGMNAAKKEILEFALKA